MANPYFGGFDLGKISLPIDSFAGCNLTVVRMQPGSHDAYTN